jgi:hypothetical protein
MATANSMHPREVRDELHRLECSPSLHDSAGLNRAPKVTVGGKAGPGKTTLPTPESELQLTDRGRTLPNFAREFARRARQGG